MPQFVDHRRREAGAGLHTVRIDHDVGLDELAIDHDPAVLVVVDGLPDPAGQGGVRLLDDVAEVIETDLVAAVAFLPCSVGTVSRVVDADGRAGFVPGARALAGCIAERVGLQPRRTVGVGGADCDRVGLGGPVGRRGAAAWRRDAGHLRAVGEVGDRELDRQIVHREVARVLQAAAVPWRLAAITMHWWRTARDEQQRNEREHDRRGHPRRETPRCMLEHSTRRSRKIRSLYTVAGRHCTADGSAHRASNMGAVAYCLP